MMITQHPLTTDYLASLRAATADLPPAERDELVSTIAEHIATTLAELDEPTEADVRTVLDRLGDPGAIAAEARGQSGAPAAWPALPSIGARPAWPGGPSVDARPAWPGGPPVGATGRPAPDEPRPGLQEWGGVAMLAIGSYLLPVIGTIAGLVMICLSRWWTTREKVLAAALSLGAVLIVPVVGLVALVLLPVSEQGESPVPAPTVGQPEPERPAAPILPR